MKKLLLPLILISFVSTAQTINFNLLVDKTAHFVAEIEAMQARVYVKQSLEFAPNIEGGFIATGTALGFSTQLGMFDNYRFYTAPKLQFIIRGGNVYPSYGAEIGIDKVYDSGLILGIRGTYDYRTDFDFLGGKSEWRPSGFIKIGWKL